MAGPTMDKEERIAQVSGGVSEERVYERAAELAELVSSMIWGGHSGWESATEKQFETLKDSARKRMRIRQRGIDEAHVIDFREEDARRQRPIIEDLRNRHYFFLRRIREMSHAVQGKV